MVEMEQFPQGALCNRHCRNTEVQSSSTSSALVEHAWEAHLIDEQHYHSGRLPHFTTEVDIGSHTHQDSETSPT